MSGGLVRRRVVVTGRVQGVFFRDSCRHEAVGRGVTGWVRNTGDGAVEAVLEGSPDDVEAVVAWCRRGPDQAEVAGVEVSEEPPTGEGTFTVR